MLTAPLGSGCFPRECVLFVSALCIFGLGGEAHQPSGFSRQAQEIGAVLLQCGRNALDLGGLWRALISWQVQSIVNFGHVDFVLRIWAAFWHLKLVFRSAFVGKHTGRLCDVNLDVQISWQAQRFVNLQVQIL